MRQPLLAARRRGALVALVTCNPAPRTTGLLIAWQAPLILAALHRPRSWFSRLIESPGCAIATRLRYCESIGCISYSLWQQFPDLPLRRRHRQSPS